MVQEQVGLPGAEDPEHVVLRQHRGMRRATKVDTVGAGFAGVCDGTLPRGRILDAIAQLLGEDPVVLRDRTPEAIRLLVEQGFLLPVGRRLRRHRPCEIRRTGWCAGRTREAPLARAPCHRMAGIAAGVVNSAVEVRCAPFTRGSRVRLRACHAPVMESGPAIFAGTAFALFGAGLLLWTAARLRLRAPVAARVSPAASRGRSALLFGVDLALGGGSGASVRLTGAFREACAGPGGRQAVVGLPFEWRCGLFPFDTGAGGTVTLRSVTVRPVRYPGALHRRRPERRAKLSPTRETAQGGRRLVIVESPAKAKTIKGYLGPGYVVEASVGHIRDLPNGAAEVPAKYKGEPWARLGVNVEHDFEPLYVVNADKKAQVKKLKELLDDSDELFLATDEDREGEAIAWHLQEVLKPKVPVRRMVFHEITKDAIQDAVANPRELNQRLVDAQETRRILDRLYGYEVSPVLWKKVMPRLSAGRVQSVATRLVVERERERIAFRSAEYWDLTGTFATGRRR